VERNAIEIYEEEEEEANLVVITDSFKRFFVLKE